jgi:hypothetical protein
MNLSDDIRGGSSNAPNQATSAALVSRSRQRGCHACIVHIYGIPTGAAVGLEDAADDHADSPKAG